MTALGIWPRNQYFSTLRHTHTITHFDNTASDTALLNSIEPNINNLSMPSARQALKHGHRIELKTSYLQEIFWKKCHKKEDLMEIKKGKKFQFHWVFREAQKMKKTSEMF